MQTQVIKGSLAPLRATRLTATRRTATVCRCSVSPQQEKAMKTTLASTALPLAALASTPLAALADEAASSDAPQQFLTPFGAVLTFAPVLIYVAFYIYREKVNPKAKITDLLYIVGAIAVFGNIFSILVFKTRFF